MSEHKFKISQSCHKEFADENSCHFQLYNKWINKLFKGDSSIYMDRGRYFEYLVIGGGAIAEDNLTELPTLLNGKKSAETQRIDAQAVRAKQTLSDLGFEIKEVQLVVEDDSFRGVIDFTAVDRNGNESIWDLKLTADLGSSFSRSQYKDLGSADYTQQAIYKKKYMDTTGKDLPTYLYIADYSTDMNVKVAEIDISYETMNRIEKKIMGTKSLIDSYIEDNSRISYNPSYEKCGKCPMSAMCNKAVTVVPIEKVYV